MSYNTLTTEQRKKTLPCRVCKKKPTRCYVVCGELYTLECDKDCLVKGSKDSLDEAIYEWNRVMTE